MYTTLKTYKDTFTKYFELDSNYPVCFEDWSFSRCPKSYEKFTRFLCYSEPYTKHYIFSISCKKIDINSELDNKFISNLIQNEKNNESDEYKNMEFILHNYHPDWNNFHIIIKDYANNFKKITLDTTQLLEDKNYLDNLISDIGQNNFRITEPDYKLINEFISLKTPLYMLMLPENIKEFKHVYAERTDPEQARIYAVSEEYLYFFYSQR